MRLAMYRLSLGLYYLFAGVWAGLLLTFALAAPNIFYRTRAYQPELGRTPADAGKLVGADAQILAGDIVNHILAALNPVQIVCAAGLVVMLFLQCTVFRRQLARPITSVANWVRSILLCLAVLALALQLFWLSPTMGQLRQDMYNPDTPQPRRQQLRDRFEFYHVLSERTLGSAAVLLVAGVLASPFVLTGDRRTDGQASS
jgi:hypothetical protein